MWIVMLGSAAIVVLIYVIMASMMGRKQALAAVLGPVVRRPVDFPSLELKKSPNQFLVCPQRHCRRATPHLEAPVFDVPVKELKERWLRMAEAKKDVTLLGSNSAGEQYDFEALTPLMGFPDTVTVRFIPLGENKTTVAIYSRSHYGRSDFGTNEKRVRAWLEELAGSEGDR